MIVTYLTYILSAIVLLGLCIFVHELGHLLGGVMVGIKARVFSLGYGKGVFKKKWGDTTYQITLIPFGGYCAFYGDDPTEKREGKNYEFLTAGPLRRMVVVVMGPLFNLFFGIILFFAMNIIGYQTETNKILFPDLPESKEYVAPAEKAGLQSGDTIVAINNDTIYSFGDIQSSVIFSEGETLQISVDRNGTKKDFAVTPIKSGERGYYSIGVVPYGESILVAGVMENSIAQKVGIETLDEIQAVDGKQVSNYHEFNQYIRKKAGEKVRLSVIRAGDDITVSIVPQQREILKIADFTKGNSEEMVDEINIDNLSLVRNAIKNGKVKLEGLTVSSFENFLKGLTILKGRTVKLEIPGGTYKGKISYEKFGFIGVQLAPFPAPDMKEVKFGFSKGLVKAFSDPVDFIVMNLKGMGMLFSGKLDVRKNLSGPIRIAKIAGDTAHYRGLSAFIILMAKISIILMVMNLLPIPAVDGSYLWFFTYELIRGRPINEKVMERIQLVGFSVLILLMVFVVFNDLSMMIPFLKDIFH
jgi:regulator of sigma E protease